MSPLSLTMIAGGAKAERSVLRAISSRLTLFAGAGGAIRSACREIGRPGSGLVGMRLGWPGLARKNFHFLSMVLKRPVRGPMVSEEPRKSTPPGLEAVMEEGDKLALELGLPCR